MRKKAASRILAYVLTLCMIIGSITWPEITAKAESITKDLKPDTGWKTVTAATDEWSGLWKGGDQIFAFIRSGIHEGYCGCGIQDAQDHICG